MIRWRRDNGGGEWGVGGDCKRPSRRCHSPLPTPHRIFRAPTASPSSSRSPSGLSHPSPSARRRAPALGVGRLHDHAAPAVVASSQSKSQAYDTMPLSFVEPLASNVHFLRSQLHVKAATGGASAAVGVKSSWTSRGMPDVEKFGSAVVETVTVSVCRLSLRRRTSVIPVTRGDVLHSVGRRPEERVGDAA